MREVKISVSVDLAGPEAGKGSRTGDARSPGGSRARTGWPAVIVAGAKHPLLRVSAQVPGRKQHRDERRLQGPRRQVDDEPPLPGGAPSRPRHGTAPHVPCLFQRHFGRTTEEELRRTRSPSGRGGERAACQWDHHSRPPRCRCRLALRPRQETLELLTLLLGQHLCYLRWRRPGLHHVREPDEAFDALQMTLERLLTSCVATSWTLVMVRRLPST